MKNNVEVVVLNWNGWKDTIICLASLKAQDYPHIQIVVVDNGSTDDSVEQIRKFMPSVELLQTGSNLGFGGGCNVGIRYALARGADYVWLINSDSIANTHALSNLVYVADKNSALGSVGSVLYEMNTAEKVQLWGGGRVRLWNGQSRHQLSPGYLDFISGASMLLRCTAIEQVGIFDESTFFMYWEDTDLSFRLRKAGWQLAVATDSRIWHKQSASLGKNSPLLDENFTQSAVRFLRRYAPIPFFSISLMLSMMLTKRIVTGSLTRAKAILKGYLKA